ncbi:MAG: hypothetical protein HY652_00695 [Acidobacteria bacterium]|nr:hypothetical protein [Acidobacteriota bacterium]
MAPEQIQHVIRTEIQPVLPALRQCHSTPALEAHPQYQRIKAHVQAVLEAVERGYHANPAQQVERSRYRVGAWNIERGIHLPAQIRALRTHPHLSRCDVLLLTEADVGMARSQNRHVVREIARALGYDYVFLASYLNLNKGAGTEFEVFGSNDLGLHGNAVLSRYPIAASGAVRLKNGRDKMRGREKRIGSQIAVLADVEFPNLRLTVASVHLDANSSQKHRRDQMADVLGALRERPRMLIGGDWNTSTYNSSTALTAIAGFWRRVFMGVDHVMKNHYKHPERYFERPLFRLLQDQGFDYTTCNLLGEPTLCYDVNDLKTYKNLSEWVPQVCFRFIEWSLRNHGGKCAMKLDWFAARGLTCANPTVVHDANAGGPSPLSDHDPICVDVVAR